MARAGSVETALTAHPPSHTWAISAHSPWIVHRRNHPRTQA
jgi:hypothetical protein